MKLVRSHLAPLDPASPVVNRRALVSRGVALAGASLLLPGGVALGQESPPIEPVDARATEEPDPTEPPVEDPDNEEPIEEIPDEPVEEEPVGEEPEVAEEEPITEQTPVDGEANVDYSATRYFAETGHNLSGVFLAAWEDRGGEDVLGLPLSEARFVTAGGVQQAFQAVTLGYLPTAQGDGPVTVLPIDPNLVPELAPESARRAVTGSSRADVFFAETGHGISGSFHDLWEELGGESFLGKPLSEVFTDNGVQQQVFENGVIERGSDRTARLQLVVEEKLLTDELLADPAFAAAPPTLGVTTLVTSDEGLTLRAAPSATAETRTVIANNAEFIAAPGEHGEWVPGYADGASGWVSAEYLSEPEALPEVDIRDWNLTVWQGAALGETNVRSEPNTQSRILRTIPYGDPVVVVDWVEGEAVEDDDDGWARLQEGAYIYLRNLGRSAPVAAPPVPNDAPREGRWIDVHLTQQLMVAYEGREVQRVTVMTSGRPGWETPEGWFAINTRVANETMESGSIGAESFYKLEDVLFTQYFTDRGHALHFAWWKTAETIGRPGSHGCLNLLLEDARFYWDWATIGTPVICRKA